MTQTHREVERKLRVHALFELPTLTDLPGVTSVEALPTFTMTNNYVDTPDLRLFRWGITLRRREGSGDSGWHIKVPVAGIDSGARDEIQFPLQEALPDEAVRLLTAFVREAELSPLVTLQTERTPYLLCGADGSPRAELVDDTVTVRDGARTAAVFREIEVEAIADADGALDEEFLDAVVQALVDLGATPSTMSKAAAALGPRALAPPDVPEARWPGVDEPIGEAVQAFVALHTRHLILQDLRLRRDLPDAVHQMRVSARRLRSGLKVFARYLDAEWADRVRSELAWMASGLGGARDTEVLRERLDAHATALPDEQQRRARSIIDPALEAATAAASGDISAIIDSARYRDLLADLVSGSQRPQLTPDAQLPISQELRPIVRKAFRRLRRRVEALEADGPAPAWHEARIAAKRARYAADAAAPILGEEVAELAHRLAQVTDVLGTHQDAHVAQQTLLSLAPGTDGPGGLALGMLLQVEVDAEMADRAEFDDLWPRVRRSARRAGLA